VGCADGVLLKALEERFPNQFSKLVGMDISPKMIEEGVKQNTNPRASFYVKSDLPSETFDIVVELGIHPFNIDEELEYASVHLKPHGYFVYDLVSSQSLFAKLKLKGKYYVKDYKTYSEYDPILKKYFSIVRTHVYGLFVPKLWSVPALARIFQPVFDALFAKITPKFFHEKIYLLKKNS
jgi:SAM-dependent methyltransferase